VAAYGETVGDTAIWFAWWSKEEDGQKRCVADMECKAGAVVCERGSLVFR
jgi:hypothetical protein